MAKRDRGTLSLFPEDRSEGLLTDTSIVRVKRLGTAAQPIAEIGRVLASLSLWQDLQLDLFWSELVGRRLDCASRSSCWRGTRTLRLCPEPRPREGRYPLRNNLVDQYKA